MDGDRAAIEFIDSLTKKFQFIWLGTMSRKGLKRSLGMMVVFESGGGRLHESSLLVKRDATCLACSRPRHH